MLFSASDPSITYTLWKNQPYQWALLFVHNIIMHWDLASRFCRAKYEGADLAVGFTKDELTQLKLQAVKDGIKADHIWLGLQKRWGTEWTFDSVVLDAVFDKTWAEGEPNTDSTKYRFGCIDHKQKNRAACKKSKFKFVCAAYEKRPGFTAQGRVQLIFKTILCSLCFSRIFVQVLKSQIKGLIFF